MSEQSKYVETYRQETEELLEHIEESILDLEENPEDMECVDNIFRSMHTIKGSGAMFGFENIAEFTHHIETALDLVRKNLLPVSNALIDLILASKDQIKAMLDASCGNAEVNAGAGDNIIAALKELMPENISATSEEGQDEQDKDEEETDHRHDDSTWRIRFTPESEIMKNGMDPFMLIGELASMGDSEVCIQTESVPCLDKLDSSLCYLSWDITLTTENSLDDIKDVFIFIEAGSRIEINAIEDYAVKNVDESLPKLGEILVDRGEISHDIVNEALGGQKKIGDLLVESGVLSREKIDSALSEQKALTRRKKQAIAGSIRVGSEKLDTLINLVGELVITQAHISQIMGDGEHSEDEEDSEISRSEFATPVEALERLTRELRDCALNMRMIPIGTTFGRFRRLVRDLSAELGKEIEMVTDGAETELDKTVIERLNDPLVHLIRNSIDHGIQTPEQREEQGKPRKGVIRLSAAHRGANVVIIIEDDGSGIDPESIRAKAIERELIQEDSVLSEEDLFALVFLPGFSTAGQVTNISGRGVGLDVVKREIDALGGSIHILSEKNNFLKFSLSLPLTLAIIDGLLVKAGNNSFVLPLSQVEECSELTEDLIDKTHGRNITLVRGKIIPLIRLREIFNIPGDPPALEHIAIVQTETVKVGIVLDQILGNIQTVIKSLDRHYRQAEGISGATIMGDGTVALILDVPGLIKCAGNEENRQMEVVIGANISSFASGYK